MDTLRDAATVRLDSGGGEVRAESEAGKVVSKIFLDLLVTKTKQTGRVPH